MAFDPLSSAFELGKTVIEKLWPDPTKRSEEMRKLEELHQKGDMAQLDAHVKLMLGQLEVNKAEAQSGNWFAAGWRPFVGWVGGFGLAYSSIIHPILIYVWAILQANGTIPSDVPAPPAVDTGILTTVLMGMLGIGSMRSFDKKAGTTK